VSVSHPHQLCLRLPAAARPLAPARLAGGERSGAGHRRLLMEARDDEPGRHDPGRAASIMIGKSR
jgi:hypothetical protein